MCRMYGVEEMNNENMLSKKVIKTTKPVDIEVCPHCDVELGNMDTTKFIKLDKEYNQVDEWFSCNHCKGKIYY